MPWRFELKAVLKTPAKIFLGLLLVPFFLALGYWYYSGLTDVAIWLWVWILGFGLTINCNWPIETKGLIFIVFSVVTSVLGTEIFKGAEYAADSLSVTMLSQVMLVTGSGLGASLLAYWLTRNDKKPK